MHTSGYDGSQFELKRGGFVVGGGDGFHRPASASRPCRWYARNIST